MLAKVDKLLPKAQFTHADACQLWEGIRNSSRDALAQLFCIYYSKLFNYGYKIVPKEAFTKDCIQELFLVLWNKRNKINEAYSVKAYLFYSLRRIMLRNLTKQRNRSTRNQEYVDTFFEGAVNVEELIIHFETEKKKKKELVKALNTLSNRQKEAIFLKFYDGLSNNEIAYIMNINKQTVYNHVSKAICHLQEFVGG